MVQLFYEGKTVQRTFEEPTERSIFMSSANFWMNISINHAFKDIHDDVTHADHILLWCGSGTRSEEQIICGFLYT